MIALVLGDEILIFVEITSKKNLIKFLQNPFVYAFVLTKF